MKPSAMLAMQDVAAAKYVAQNRLNAGVGSENLEGGDDPVGIIDRADIEKIGRPTASLSDEVHNSHS